MSERSESKAVIHLIYATAKEERSVKTETKLQRKTRIVAMLQMLVPALVCVQC